MTIMKRILSGKVLTGRTLAGRRIYGVSTLPIEFIELSRMESMGV